LAGQTYVVQKNRNIVVRCQLTLPRNYGESEKLAKEPEETVMALRKKSFPRDVRVEKGKIVLIDEESLARQLSGLNKNNIMTTYLGLHNG